MAEQTDTTAAPRGNAGREPLNRGVIAEAALRLAEAAGLEELTMRALASELGAGTMTLYTHVRGRDDLLQAIVERLIAELDMPGVTARAGGDWREHLAEVLDAYKSLAERFPRSFELLALAPYADGPVAPHLASAERALIAGGLHPSDARVALGTADAFATGFLVVRARTALRAEGPGAAAASHSPLAYARGVAAVIAGIAATLEETPNVEGSGQGAATAGV
ncbi:TetR/AcrR family transcriptional regulator [Leucobacter chromiireducens]|uniref:TetR/AcrR family transcriptional regulator n=1 Tax=Leucobacter chromiireducens subsp. chromiireducens TaxID=660067 RepID=A0ABS1SUK1_9MICO|nr:TetR/AcrR family transcriptional regulator [Leucobacter chromiireducens]MBL3690857.1 TetR/AcrR family transcriptional regulator [Leucobacter chromiireducens subsp. chromiireducens]